MQLRNYGSKVARLWSRLPNKARYAVLAAFVIFTGTIVRLNIENWATDIGIHQLYRQELPSWLMKIWSAIFGPFGLGFVLGALLFTFWDSMVRWLTWRHESRGMALQKLFKEGVSSRNGLLLPIKEFDYAQERARMVEWSDRTVQAMKDANVALKRWSGFEILNKFEPELIGAAGRGAQQTQLEAIWNRKLDLLREVIEQIGE